MNIVSYLRGDSSLLPAQKRIREIILYFFFGGLTTLVNFISFVVFDKIFGSRQAFISIGSLRFDLLAYDILNNTVAWAIAVTFAYITNRTFVFGSKGPIMREFFGFVTSRIATLVAFELGTFELFILILQNGFGIDKGIVLLTFAGQSWTYLYLVKILNSVLIVIGNYILSKIFVFRADGPQAKRTDAISNTEESGRDSDQ